MFGKAEWFSECCTSKRLVPATWQGWLYALVFIGLITLPALLLVSIAKGPEAAIWAIAVMTFGIWDLRQVRSAKCKSAADEEDVLYIGDDDNSKLATRNFEMRLRN